jgi:hypothetical protein
MEDNFGKSMFTEEEIAKEKQEAEERKAKYEAELAQGFWQDGKVRNLVITGIDKEDKISQKGNNYVLHTYHFTDTDTSETETLVDRNFAFTNAFQDVKREAGTSLRYGVTVFSVKCVKDGEREWNGMNYPIWAYEVVNLGNPAGAAATTPASASSEPF